MQCLCIENGKRRMTVSNFCFQARAAGDLITSTVQEASSIGNHKVLILVRSTVITKGTCPHRIIYVCSYNDNKSTLTKPPPNIYTKSPVILINIKKEGGMVRHIEV